MKIEEKYLDKNYYIKDNTIFKTIGISTTWFSVLNDIKLVFFLSYEECKLILETWVCNKGVSPEKLYLSNTPTIGFIEDGNSEYIFPINNFSHSCNREQIEIPFGYQNSGAYQKIIGRVNHELKVEVFKTHQDERFVDYLLHKPSEVFQAIAPVKFKMTVINDFKTKYVCEGCLLIRINYDVDCDYDENDEYYGSEMKFNFEITPDVVKVESMSDES